MPTKKTGHPVKNTTKQIAMQRQLTVLGVVVVIFLIIFGAGAIWGKGVREKCTLVRSSAV